MKRAVFPLFILLFFMMEACQKTDNGVITNQKTSPYFMTAFKNGVAWQADTVDGVLKGDTASISGAIVSNSPTSGKIPESLRIAFKLATKGSYALKKSQVMYVTQFGPDLPPSYQLYIDTTYNNTITIDNYDSMNSIVSGSFNLRFINNSNSASISYISFLGAKFNVALHK